MNIEPHRVEIEAALTKLSRFGFDVNPLWTELHSRAVAFEQREPTDTDRTWATRSPAPTPVAEHLMEEHTSSFPIELEDGRKIWVRQTKVEPETLSASNCFDDRQYTLSSGQRALLKSRYELTPTATVVVVKVITFPNSPNLIHSFTLMNGQHIDPRLRKRVLSKVYIHNAADFFEQAEAYDKQKEVERKVTTSLVESALTLGRVIDLQSEDRWAIEDITGVKVKDRVEVTGVSDDRFVVMCLKSGNTAKVPRKEFFETVKEYERLYETSKPTRKKVDRDVRTLESVMKELGL